MNNINPNQYIFTDAGTHIEIQQAGVGQPLLLSQFNKGTLYTQIMNPNELAVRDSGTLRHIVNIQYDLDVVTPSSSSIVDLSNKLDIIFAGGGGGGGAITSVFGRTGGVVATNGDYTASQVTNVPNGNLSSITVQGALNELQGDINNIGTNYQLKSEKGVANGYAPLDANNLIPMIHIPPLNLTDPFVVNSQAAMLALPANRGDFAIRTDINRTFVLTTNTPTNLTDWQEVLTPGSVVSVNGQTGVVSLTTTNIAEGTNLYFTDERVDDRVAALLQAGTGVSLVYNDAANTLTISGSTQYTDEMAQDSVGNILTDSTTIDFTYDDTANTITAIAKVSSTAGNTLTSDANGLFVPTPVLTQTPITVTNTNSIGLTASGTNNHTIQADVKVSATANNTVQVLADGLYVNRYNSLVQTVPAVNTTTNINLNLGNIVLIPMGGLTANTSLAITNPVLGGSYIFRFTGNSNRNVTFTNFIWDDGLAFDGFDSSLASTEVIAWYDGTNYIVKL